LTRHQRSSADGNGISVRAAVAAAGLGLVCVMSALLLATQAHAAAGTADRDPELRAAVQAAINESQCFSDKYDSEVWYKLMEPKLRHYIRDPEERLQLLSVLWCEARRDPEIRLPPGLLLAVIQVESGFDRWAVSSSGAVGLMQIMPFWPEQLGMHRRDLIAAEPNIRMGCAILRFYLKRERRDVRRALGRYNGSVASRTYADSVVSRWTSLWYGADDMALGRG
jgi:soluble lytic murein transglycosylase-like protein